MGNLDEISYNEFIYDIKSVDNYLKMITLSSGRRYTTYPKLEGMEDTFSTYYNNLIKFYDFKINKNEIVIDIGAHHGIISISFASLGASVFSYEPNPINYYILNKNKILNNDLNIYIFENAVIGSKNTKNSLLFNFGLTSTTGSLKEAQRNYKRTAIDIEVKTKKFDSILSQHESIKLLKIDCEGTEYDIFKDLSKDELKKVSYIYMEAHPTIQHKPEEFEHIFTNLGFSSVAIPTHHGCIDYICKNNGKGEYHGQI